MQTLLSCLLLLLCVKAIFLSPLDKKLPCDLPLECTFLSNCPPLLKMLKASSNISQTFRFIESQICGNEESDSDPKICCPEGATNHKSIKKQLAQSPCKPSFQCTPLLECGSLIYLLSLEKPIPQRVVKFIKSQQCEKDDDDLYPKVCCKTKTNAENIKNKKQSNLKLKEKMILLNRFFNSEYFGFTIYDLL